MNAVGISPRHVGAGKVVLQHRARLLLGTPLPAGIVVVAEQYGPARAAERNRANPILLPAEPLTHNALQNVFQHISCGRSACADLYRGRVARLVPTTTN